jgi:hypothetical protein
MAQTSGSFNNVSKYLFIPLQFQSASGKIYVQPPANAATGLIQVRDSIDSLFAKEYIPLQP